MAHTEMGTMFEKLDFGTAHIQLVLELPTTVLEVRLVDLKYLLPLLGSRLPLKIFEVMHRNLERRPMLSGLPQVFSESSIALAASSPMAS